MTPRTKKYMLGRKLQKLNAWLRRPEAPIRGVPLLHAVMNGDAVLQRYGQLGDNIDMICGALAISKEILIEGYKDSFSLSREKLKVHAEEMKVLRSTFKPYFRTVYDKFMRESLRIAPK